MAYPVPAIPESLRENLAFGLGEAQAERWLAGAVERAEALFLEWDLRPELVLSGGSESLCVKCDGPRGSTVLKLPTSLDRGAAEIAALQVWDGDGAPRVLLADVERGALLMNFLGWVGEGSYTLTDVLDLVDRLHDATADGQVFPSLEANLDRRVGWATARFEEIGDDAAGRDVVTAQELLDELLSGGAAQVLLHGDYQPKNLIVSDHGLTVVDPLPAVGPVIFDLALWVVKCGEDRALTGSVDELVELRPHVDRDLLVRWCWALAVLESRPYLGARNEHRARFIQEYRDKV